MARYFFHKWFSILTNYLNAKRTLKVLAKFLDEVHHDASVGGILFVSEHDLIPRGIWRLMPRPSVDLKALASFEVKRNHVRRRYIIAHRRRKKSDVRVVVPRKEHLPPSG